LPHHDDKHVRVRARAANLHSKGIVMPGKFAPLAALAAGGLFLSKQANRAKARLPHVEFTSPGPGPTVSVRKSLVLRPPASGRSLAALAAVAVGGYLAYSQLKKSRGFGRTSSVQETIELNVPLSTAYNQWTQFEEFPKFMDSVQQVKQIDDTHLHWRALVAGKPKEWDAEITEQIPDHRIAWRSIGGVQNSGAVTFQRVGVNRTRVNLQIDYDPETISEKIGDAVGAVKLTAKGNLKRFKELVEAHGAETGAWRGTVAPH
jgi:uncharacterized membrane protein